MARIQAKFTQGSVSKHILTMSSSLGVISAGGYYLGGKEMFNLLVSIKTKLIIILNEEW